MGLNGSIGLYIKPFQPVHDELITRYTHLLKRVWL